MLLEAPITTIFTAKVPGCLNIRAGGTYCVLVEADLSPEAQEILEALKGHHPGTWFARVRKP